MRRRHSQKDQNAFRFAAFLAVLSVLLMLLIATLLLLRAVQTRPTGLETALPDAVSTELPEEEPKASAALTDAAPTPAATTAPMPRFSFTDDPAQPMIAQMEQLGLGMARTLGGTVACNYPITRMTAMIVRDYCEDPFYPYLASVSFAPEDRVMEYRLTDAKTNEGVSLASLLQLDTLKVGVHTLVLTGICENALAPSQQVLAVRFYVLGGEWETFEESDFSNDSYSTALAFFNGDTSRFIYRYQNGFGRYTVADPEWESAYITEFPMDDGDPWLIHIDAVPYYERLRAYLKTTRVRVHGTNGDTGVLPLETLIVAYHGSYVSRFTSAKLRYISHHALGTTTDVNATMAPNENTSANSALIDGEVRNLLAYNGVQTDAAAGQYYDFTYSGSYRCTDFGVPETVINYLLYELAFYRAGFQWGHYYNSTSDGMHFSLTDHIRVKHDGPKGLQKVTEYYN